MSVESLLRSIRRWLLVVAFLLGVGLVALAAIGYEVSGATDGTLYATIGSIGGGVALLTGLSALLSAAASLSTPAGEEAMDAD